MILSAQTIRDLEIISPCLPREQRNGMSAGMSYAGYDATADLSDYGVSKVQLGPPNGSFAGLQFMPSFLLVATAETFKMPDDVIGFVHPKSTWNRKGLTALSCVLEPGWEGQLTVAMAMHGQETVTLHQGDPICQIVFQQVDRRCEPYRSKYQGDVGVQGPK